MIPRRAATSLLFLAVLVAGCAATTPPADASRSTSPPRVRCLSDQARDTAQGTRPLFFFFCIESP